jgi:hypothetical protein
VGFFKRSSEQLEELEPVVLPGGRPVEIVGESYDQDSLPAPACKAVRYVRGGQCETVTGR